MATSGSLTPDGTVYYDSNTQAFGSGNMYGGNGRTVSAAGNGTFITGLSNDTLSPGYYVSSLTMNVYQGFNVSYPYAYMQCFIQKGYGGATLVSSPVWSYSTGNDVTQSVSASGLNLTQNDLNNLVLNYQGYTAVFGWVAVAFSTTVYWYATAYPNVMSWGIRV